MKRRVFVGIGSNSGDRLAYLRSAVEALPGVVAVSPVYETEAVGDEHGSAAHLNAVVLLVTDVSARALLNLVGEAEQRAGRDRSVTGAPCSLDIDILLVENEEINEPDLVVPHPRMWQRRFVLAPFADIAPELIPSNLLEQATGKVRRLTVGL